MKINNIKFREVAKDRWFYDQWQYSMTFCLQEATCLRDLDHKSIDQTLENRRKWRQIQQQRWQRGQTILVNTLNFQDITEQISQDLHAVADMLLNSQCKFKSVVSINTAWIYTNDLKLLKQLSNLSCIKHVGFSQAVIKRSRNVILLKNSQYHHRSYFRMQKLTGQQKQTLVKFLENHQSFVRLSPSLENWLMDGFLRTQDYFFVDHKDIGWLTMLSLVSPNSIRKTMQIEQDK